MSLPRAPHAVIFDMDGLIFDTEVLYRAAMILAAQSRGHEMPLPLFLSMIGLPGDSSRRVLNDHFGEAFDVDAFWASSHEHFQGMTAARQFLKAGVIELLDALDAANLPRAIATSSGHNSVEHHLTHHGLEGRFHAVIAQGDYKRGKPHPDPFLKAAERLGVAPELCLALEDSHNGVRAASSAGMMTVMVPDMLDPTEEMHTLCVRIARDLHEVRGWLG
jgi:HAD superfamily hydrolase (TIGR01509 family)